jgi:hypothetical protein
MVSAGRSGFELSTWLSGRSSSPCSGAIKFRPGTAGSNPACSSGESPANSTMRLTDRGRANVALVQTAAGSRTALACAFDCRCHWVWDRLYDPRAQINLGHDKPDTNQGKPAVGPTECCFSTLSRVPIRGDWAQPPCPLKRRSDVDAGKAFADRTSVRCARVPSSAAQTGVRVGSWWSVFSKA